MLRLHLKFPWLTPHAADPSLDGVSFPGINCPVIIWSFVQLSGSQCCGVMWLQMRSVECVCGDVIKRKQQAKPTETQRTKYFAKCTEKYVTHKKHHAWVPFSFNFGALGHLRTILGPPWDSKGSGIRSRIAFSRILAPNGDRNGDPKIKTGATSQPTKALRSCFGRVFFWSRVWTPL